MSHRKRETVLWFTRGYFNAILKILPAKLQIQLQPIEQHQLLAECPSFYSKRRQVRFENGKLPIV
jgi:hypothetical protein